MLRFLTFTLACALLAACASPSPQTGDDEIVEAPAEPVTAAEEVPERAFPDDSIYALLVAEFALRRGEFDVALAQYMALAPLLRDAGVSAHATHLGQYLQRDAETLEAAELWVELDPQNIEAQHTLGTLLVRNGRTAEALPHLALVERSGKSANFPGLLNGFNELNDQQRSDLVRGVNELATEFPENTQLLLTQALILAEQNDFPAAMDKLEALFKLEPEQPQALILEARILLQEQDEEPFAHLEQVLRAQPDDSQLRLQYARLLTSVDMQAARAQFEILSAQSPRDGDLLFSLALINRETGDYLAAAAYLRQVLALGQREEEAYYYLGRIAEDRDEPEEAITAYKQVGESREYLLANNRIGVLLIEAGRHEESLDWFNEQRRKHPQRREQLYGLEADILTQSGAPEQAIELLNQALVESPDSHPLRYARAMLFEQQDELTAMERDLRTILAAEPDNTTALNALGYTLANRTERYEEALQLVSRALELQPNEPAILDSMGWVLFRTGRNEEALAYLTRAYREFPDPEVAAHLGEVLWASGKWDAALAVWRGAALRDPEHAVLRSTLDRLEIDIDSLHAAPAENAPPAP